MPVILKIGLIAKRDGEDVVFTCINKDQHNSKKEIVLSTGKYETHIKLLKKKDRIFECDACGVSYTIPKIK